MATHPATPYQTTLAAAITASQVTISTAASTGFAVGSYVVVGKEVLLLTAVDTTNHVHSVKRGMRGTKAAKHVSGAIVTLGTASAFGPNTNQGVEVAGYSGDYGTPVLPIGSEWTDPDTGYVYILCDSAAAYIQGEWVAISAAGAASQLASTSRGRCGIVVEAVSASDKLFWALQKGSFAATNATSDVTTAMMVVAGTGTVDWNTSNTAPWIRNAVCTTAPSTATSPGLGGGVSTFYINYPWVQGGDGSSFVS